MHYRAIWLSDIHLGTKASSADRLLAFMKQNDSDMLYLNGDIIDGWHLRKHWYWPESHQQLLEIFLERAARIPTLYIAGNHDEGWREFLGQRLGQITIVDEVIHTAADGKTYLVLHGDQFDLVVQNIAWMAHAGDVAYNILLGFNRILNFVRRRLGYGYWSLAAYLKQMAKKMVNKASDFEQVFVKMARQRGVDGIICGHTHKAEQRVIDGITYLNDGDWVESCTALVEHLDGRMEILYFKDSV